MGVIASLDERDVAVEAGESATCSVRLHNTGHTVDTFTLDVLGEAAEWTTVQPESVNVFPGDDAVVVLTFTPPRSADVPCGTKAFALRIMAQEDTDGSVIEEGTVEVGGFAELAAELVPRTVRGARAARTKLAVDNFGNGPVTVQFTGKDESGAVGFRFKPAQTVVEGGTTQLIPVRMRMKRRFLTGQPKTVPIEIGLTASDGTKLDTAGVVIQPALLPRWLPKALTFGVAGVVLLAVLAPAVFDALPTSKAAAGGLPNPDGDDRTPVLPGGSPSPGTSPGTLPETPGANDPGQTTGQGSGPDGAGAAGTGGSAASGSNGAVSSGGSGGSNGAVSSGGSGGSNGAVSSGGSDGSGGGSSPVNPPAGGASEPTAESIRIQGQAIVGSTDFVTRSRKVQAGQTIKVGEVILTNPAGSAGTLEIRKNSTVLLKRDLATLTHERYGFQDTVTFNAGDAIVVAVRCEASSTTCSPTALFPAMVTGG
ncbi:hypothetical protein OTB20_38615 [Streptomyces sp. H27-H1]|uniref:COG1470 family protein n=1 Tax=Streptomyces sp. H27-H1 TaxID=2996461 RepID=UPI00226D91F5|nr:hypothetical protein [Streptomyces sp. H27-H1]MCY0931990.1 hypothetical protein [Streptomyces sp. H27-H1]